MKTSPPNSFTLFAIAVWISLLAALLTPSISHAQAPGIITYQGRITNNGTSFSGTGQFRFLIYRDGMPPASLWSHDSSSLSGAMPATAVSLPVTNGLFAVGLGDTAVPGMTVPVPSPIFANASLRVRIWFSDGVIAPAVIADHAITSVGYAFFAQSVADGSITSGKLATGAVNSTALANDVTFTNLRLDSSGTETMALNASTGAGQGGLLTFRNGLGASTFVLDADTTGRGSSLAMSSGFGIETVTLDSHIGGAGSLVLHDAQNFPTVQMLSATAFSEGALLTMRNGFNHTTVSLDADASGNAAALALYNNAGNLTVLVDADEGNGIGGIIEVNNQSGSKRAELDGQGASGGGELVLMAANGTTTVNIRGGETATTGSLLEMYKADGTRTVWIDADSAGEGKVTTQVLEITGGADFSENFDITSADAQPGMLVKIDPAHPGELTVSDRAYDRAVAGVVSGAGGVKPGVMMGQRGTAANGLHPVALTGRVYCLVDADRGAIAPGDLITTSDTAGHGMKAADSAQAQGAIVGKAMTPLAGGRGLVLVLVSLQ
ncbi:MAG: hypothetical protein WCF18_12190 [Chthoniobacteraceae bacterium]